MSTGIMRLNLGCSTDLHNGWLNVDIAPPCDQVADLALPWPWEDSTVDKIYAADIFEHIGDCQHAGLQICPVCYGEFGAGPWSPAKHGRHGGASGCDLCGVSPCVCRQRAFSGRVHVMNESWRVLNPGGVLTMECPDAAKGAGAFQDPQHVSFWTPNSLQYYTDGSAAHKRFAVAYGITARFKVLSVTERQYAEVAGPKTGSSVLSSVWKFTATLEAVK